MLIVMDKSTHEEKFSQPLQTYNEQNEIAVIFLMVYISFFNVKNKNIKLKTPINDDSFNKISILPSAYELETLNEELE